MGSENAGGAYFFLSLVVRHALLQVFAEAFKQHKRCVTLIAVPDGRADAQTAQNTHSSNAEDNFLGKPLLAVGWMPGLELPGIGIDPGVDREWLAVACATAVVFGHVYPVWYEFRGGKGAATLLGAVAVLAPIALVPVLLVWLATVMLTGYVGLGTMLGTATLPLYFASVAPRSTPLMVFGAVLAAFIVFTHRSNVQRMREGVENRARRLWLLRPR